MSNETLPLGTHCRITYYGAGDQPELHGKTGVVVAHCDHYIRLKLDNGFVPNCGENPWNPGTILCYLEELETIND